MTQKRQRDDNKGFRLPDNLAAEMDKLIGKHGFTSRAEIAKQAIREYLDQHKETERPRFEHFNIGPNGAKITDRQKHIIADIFFRPEGVKCDACEKNNCEHIDFALTVPKIRQAIRARRQDGWELPDIGEGDL